MQTVMTPQKRQQKRPARLLLLWLAAVYEGGVVEEAESLGSYVVAEESG
jgi:hypothetical protein